MAVANSSTFAHPKITLYFPDSGIPPLGEGESKNRLPSPVYQRYSSSTAPQWAVGRSNPNEQKATLDAYSVFFIVAALTHLHSTAYRCSVSMVALTGQPRGWSGSFCSDIATPVNVITLLERSNSGDDSLTKRKETATMVNCLRLYYSPLSVAPRPIFLWRFYSCQQSRYVTAIANTEQQARELLPDAPCVFSARFRGGVA